MDTNIENEYSEECSESSVRVSEDAPFEINNYTDSKKKIIFNKEAKVKIYTLYQLCKIIDLAMKRGAFHANEASLIGLFYDIIYKSIKEAFEKYSST